MDFVTVTPTSLLAKKLYLGREKTGDVTFVVESKRIPAHRSVLAALSPKYEAQFYGSQPDQGDVVVKDISAAAFSEFIKFLYLEEADITLETLEDILNLSKQCLVNFPVVKCEAFLKSVLTEENVCCIYYLANLYDLKSVQDLCEQLIGECVPELFESDDFLGCNHDTLLRILDIDSLNCNEIDVFEGCIRWAHAACQRNNLDNMGIGQLRVVLGVALTKIRFKSLNLYDFVNLHETYKGFFTAEEFIEITNIIGGLPKFTSQKFNQTSRIQTQLKPVHGTRVAQYQPPLSTDKSKYHHGMIYITNVRLQCITAMVEYENKTIEELRLEDYSSKRKGLHPYVRPVAVFEKH